MYNVRVDLLEFVFVCESS